MSESPSYQAARTGSAFIDLSTRGRIVVAGDDRVGYLQGLLTNDIEALSPGYGCYAAYLTPQGRMLADMRVLDLGTELLLDVHPSVTGLIVDRFREFVFTEDVTVEDRSALWGALGVHGPEAARVVCAVVRPRVLDRSVPAGVDEIAGYPEHRHLVGDFDGAPVVAARWDETGDVGFVLYAETGIRVSLGEALSAAGSMPLDPATFDVLRVESGRPAFPADLTQETIPLEAGIEDRAISTTKGCYVGQEVIIRILHRGQGRVGRRLVGLAFGSSGAPPGSGAVLMAGDDPDPVGIVTSSVWSPALEQSIALGYVKRELADGGTRLVASDGDRKLPGVVTSLPFLARPASTSDSRSVSR